MWKCECHQRRWQTNSKYLKDHINLMFNPARASHMEGSWERMVGVARCILDSPLLDVKNLTHDLLATLMAQISSIVNVRPHTPRTTLPPCPFLTEKSTYQKEWPVGKIVKAYPCSDNCVCKTDVRVGSDRINHKTTYNWHCVPLQKRLWKWMNMLCI